MPDDEDLDAPDGWNDEALGLLQEKAEAMDEDPELDTDATKRQDEGWVKFYVECPECETPMARATVESENGQAGEDITTSSTQIRCVCPDCGEIASVLDIHRRTGPVDDLLWTDD